MKTKMKKTCEFCVDGSKQHFTVAEGEKCGTLTAQMGNGVGYVPIVSLFVCDARGNGLGGLVSPTITGDHQNRITDYTAIVIEKHEKGI